MRKDIKYFKKDLLLAVLLSVLCIFANVSISLLGFIEFLLFVCVLIYASSHKYFSKSLSKYFLSFARKFQLVYFFVLLLFVVTHVRNDFFVVWSSFMAISMVTAILIYKLSVGISDEMENDKEIQIKRYAWYILAILAMFAIHHLFSSYVINLSDSQSGTDLINQAEPWREIICLAIIS